jgi:hypothetical protein
MEGADDFRDELARMKRQAEETERRTDELVDTLEGRETAIREKARDEVRGDGHDEDLPQWEEEALDGFEFLSMAEAGPCHWEIVDTIAETAGEREVKQLADWAVPVQCEHVETVRRPRSRWRSRRPARW